MESTWFKKGYKPAKFKKLKNVDSSDIDLLFGTSNDCTVSDQKEEKDRRPSFLNAFDIISPSEGLNLSGLFEKEQGVRREMRFTLRCSASEIMAKMEESAKPLGFSVKRCDYKMRQEGRDLGRKGHLTISTEVFEVSPLLSVVEMKKARGDTLEFDRVEAFSAIGRAKVVLLAIGSVSTGRAMGEIPITRSATRSFVSH
ncbi:CBL-interacting protein kinase 31-like isoform X2 [Magnolia sinica]|uniref:CBL-interacting protein kinase 31-like isoform X2 n=1 Tax=Magnolia sinica TaxID=86752 RepID=UPI0026587094|nr:CBL-interacting protein kinase 31-like isoform X2 [Magnolia sinica]